MTVKVSIEGEGLKFDSEATLQKAGQIIAFLSVEHVEIMPSGASAEAPRILGGTSSTGRTPRQIIDQASAKSNPQKIAAVGLYFKERGQNVFTRSEITEQFRRAGEQIPKNMGRDLKDAVRSGFICESEGQRDEYYLTYDAETLISQGFVPGGFSTPKARSSKPKARKSTSSTQEPTNQDLKQITFTPIVDGLPYYWKTKKGDRVLWILHVAKNNGIHQMDNKDIEYVGKQLDDHISSSNVNSLTEINRKQRGYLTKQGNIYTLLGPGIVYLEKLAKEVSDEI